MDHANCVCWTDDFGGTRAVGWGEHVKAGKVAAVRDFKLDEGVADLWIDVR